MKELKDLRLDNAICVTQETPASALKMLNSIINRNGFIPPVNYKTTSAQLRDFINGKRTAEQIYAKCASLKDDSNANCNRETCEIGIKHFSRSQAESAYTIAPELWWLRKDVSIKCQVAFGYNHEGQAVLFVPQYRKNSMLLNVNGLLLQASVIHHVFARDDFEDALVQTVDMSAGPQQASRKSISRIYDPTELVSGDELYERFQPFLDAWDVFRGIPKGDDTSGIRAQI